LGGGLLEVKRRVLLVRGALLRARPRRALAPARARGAPARTRSAPLLWICRSLARWHLLCAGLNRPASPRPSKEHSLEAMARTLFNCLQVEIRGAPQMTPGRYVLRGGGSEEIEHVLVIEELREQPPARRTRLTLIDAPPLTGPQRGQERLQALDPAAELAHLQRLLARVYLAARIANGDPDLHAPPEWGRIEVVRAGFGAGEELAHGRLSAARELALPAGSPTPSPRPRFLRRRSRAQLLEPRERFAAILSGRLQPLLCEELALRARADLDHGRLALGAILLDRAYALALSELSITRSSAAPAPASAPTPSAPQATATRPSPRLAERIAELTELHREVARAATAAIEHGGALPRTSFSERPEGILREALERLEATLRARALGVLSGRGVI
jgi:hypothetical protein